MATKAELANIKKLQAQVDAQKQKVFQTMGKISPTISKVDPAEGLKLAQKSLKNAAPGSPAYVAGLDAVRQATNVITGVTAQRTATSKAILSGSSGGSDYTPPVQPPSGSSTSDALLQQLLAQQNSASAQYTKDKEQDRKSAIEVLTARFKQYGLESLASTIQRLAVDGATEATITLGLMETNEYKQRFKANSVRVKNGTSVLSPADYLNLEDTYRQVLRAYGLTQFDTDAYVSQFIGNDMSATELSNRVVTAVQRVQNADPAVLQQLTAYYGIGSKDLVAYVLDPSQQFQKIERQVAAGEIGVAAARQGLTAGVTVAEQLASQGITQAEAQKGYSTIADILPTANKLGEIYGGQMDKYGQAEAEQEVFNGLASAQRKRQKLSETEIGTFSSSSGMNKSSFSSSNKGSI